jgi:hypothetical protein
MSVAKRDVPGVIRASYQGDIGYVAGLLLLIFNYITSYQNHHMSCASDPNIPPPHTHTQHATRTIFQKLWRLSADEPRASRRAVGVQRLSRGELDSSATAKSAVFCSVLQSLCQLHLVRIVTLITTSLQIEEVLLDHIPTGRRKEYQSILNDKVSINS